MTVFRGQPELLRQFRDGERAALETVYRFYLDKVVAIVRNGLRMPTRDRRVRPVARRPEDLSDLVQEIFLRAFARPARAGFDGLRDYAPYLFALARNVMIDWARQVGRDVPTDWLEVEAMANATGSSLEEDEDLDPNVRAVVDAYIAGLDDELRALHEVRYLRGLSQQEGAAALGISRQTLRTLESRLRRGLRRALKHRELRTVLKRV
jgi:RNA polymerase sigma factor (sigma-70 family)